MASIKEVKGSKKGAYRITVSNGYDMNGKQIKVSTNYTPDPAKTRKQQLKEAEEYAFEFEKKV
ncbi:MAG TPA: site-specific integrase, partial [Candidatus Dorea intestinigallinarum]|nr:site-specific integrase [Candidatus Dorea intestinigallinarum]